MHREERTYSPSHGVSWKWAHGEAVLLNLSRSKYLVLEGAAGRIWELLCRGDTPERVRCSILEEFETSEAVVTRELDSFVGELCADGWIVPKP